MSYQIKITEPIIKSILDFDHYKATMGEVVFHDFHNVQVSYKFTNRGGTVFPDGFGFELRHQIELLAGLSMTQSEFLWLNGVTNYLRPTYIEWLRGFRYNPNCVYIQQSGGDLDISIYGPWYQAIFWETTLMAIISELYFNLTGAQKCDDWLERIIRKADLLEDNTCHWIDFGTRRRFSYEVQDAVVETMRNRAGFLGTSNVHLAHKHGLIPQGTYAHEGPMAMSGIYGARMANQVWMKHWAEHYDGKLGIALTDTFTTDVFLQDFSHASAKLFDGARQDSGSPYAWGSKMLATYDFLDIPTANKRLVFSDALKVGNPNDSIIGDAHNYIAIEKHFRKFAQPIGGIGTFLTNDVGSKPLNMVIKLATVDCGNGPVEVVKLSDDAGKNSGNAGAIARVKAELGIQNS